jgi:hypothetical protein
VVERGKQRGKQERQERGTDRERDRERDRDRDREVNAGDPNRLPHLQHLAYAITSFSNIKPPNANPSTPYPHHKRAGRGVNGRCIGVAGRGVNGRCVGVGVGARQRRAVL